MRCLPNRTQLATEEGILAGGSSGGTSGGPAIEIARDAALPTTMRSHHSDEESNTKQIYDDEVAGPVHELLAQKRSTAEEKRKRSPSDRLFNYSPHSAHTLVNTAKTL